VPTGTAALDLAPRDRENRSEQKSNNNYLPKKSILQVTEQHEEHLQNILTTFCNFSVLSDVQKSNCANLVNLVNLEKGSTLCYWGGGGVINGSVKGHLTEAAVGCALCSASSSATTMIEP
jgi:hypothetical protein